MIDGEKPVYLCLIEKVINFVCVLDVISLDIFKEGGPYLTNDI